MTTCCNYLRMIFYSATTTFTFFLALISFDVYCWCGASDIEAKEGRALWPEGAPRNTRSSFLLKFDGNKVLFEEEETCPLIKTDDAEADDVLINLYLSAKREGDAVKLRMMRSLMSVRRALPSEGKINLAEKLRHRGEDNLDKLLDGLETMRPDLFLRQVRDMIMAAEGGNLDPEVLLLVAEAFLEAGPSFIENLFSDCEQGESSRYDQYAEYDDDLISQYLSATSEGDAVRMSALTSLCRERPLPKRK